MPSNTPPAWRCDCFEAPTSWRQIDFISDLHLDVQHPRTTQAFKDYLASTTADAVIILGDLFEAWVGDDMRSLPFEAGMVEAMALTGQRLWLGIMVGNRDFLMGSALMAACHARLLHDPFVLSAFGKRHLLTHGDAWCLADHDYQQFRAMVRQDAWQQAFLAKPLAARLDIARQMREASEARKAKGQSETWADVDEPCAIEHLSRLRCEQLIHGHTHRPGSVGMGADGATRHVLSDWDLDSTPGRAEVFELTAEGTRRVGWPLATLRD
jgi:UDP-2,3-diacylglucosamine hydrolase